MKSSEFHKHINHCCTVEEDEGKIRIGQEERAERWEQQEVNTNAQSIWLLKADTDIFVGVLFWAG